MSLSLYALAHGLIITLSLSAMALFLGGILAYGMTACSYSRTPVLHRLIQALIYFVRGTPLLIQIFIIYFGLSQFAWLRHSYAWWWFKSPWACAVTALAINTACYTTVLFNGVIRYSVPANEIAATKALGMSAGLAFRRIIFPRAYRLALPAYSNEVIMIVKSTSLAFTITLMDIMGVTQELIAETYASFKWYLIAGAIYLTINLFILALFRYLQQRLILKAL